MDYFVYAIKSVEYNYIYVGMTTNITRRLAEHNAGKTPSNRYYAPFHLFYYETYSTREDARAREKKLKSGSGKEWLREHLNKREKDLIYNC